jgi:hypothetical protein
MTRVVLHIDRLVLNGLQRGDASAIAAGLQRELQARLAGSDARAALARQGNVGRLNVGEVRLAPNAGASSLGKALAGGIVRGGQR